MVVVVVVVVDGQEEAGRGLDGCCCWRRGSSGSGRGRGRGRRVVAHEVRVVIEDGGEAQGRWGPGPSCCCCCCTWWWWRRGLPGAAAVHSGGEDEGRGVQWHAVLWRWVRCRCHVMNVCGMTSIMTCNVGRTCHDGMPPIVEDRQRENEEEEEEEEDGPMAPAAIGGSRGEREAEGEARSMLVAVAARAVGRRGGEMTSGLLHIVVAK